MKRTLALALTLGSALTLVGCGATENTNQANSNTGNPPRQAVVEATPIPANTNSDNVSSNTAVLTNNNGNKNTAAVKSMNDNVNANANSRRRNRTKH